MSKNKVKKSMDDMFFLMDRYSEYGASDTEPRAEFACMLRDFKNGETVIVPKDAEGWQLYSDMPGAGVVAGALHDMTVLVLERANKDYRGFLEAIEYYYGGLY